MASAAVGLSIGMGQLRAVEKVAPTPQDEHAFYDHLIRDFYLPVLIEQRQNDAAWRAIVKSGDGTPYTFPVRFGRTRGPTTCTGFPGNYGSPPPRYPE